VKRIFEPLSSAWVSVITHKLRSFLTILGVVIGVAAVIILMSVGQGTSSRILSSLSSLGANSITVRPGSNSSGGIRLAFGSASTLTLEDARAILSSVSNINGVAPVSNSLMQVIAGSKNMFVQITGITTSYQDINSVVLDEGDLITQSDYDKHAKVALIGSTVSSTLFPGANPIGQKIRMSGNIFTVAGLLKSKGAGLNSNDNNILIPLSTLQGMTSSLTTTGQHTVNSITVQASGTDVVDQVESDITDLLRTRHKIAVGADADFSVSSTQDITNTLTQSSQSLTLLLGAIAGISLLVGGIGVMNIMLVAVMERRREIGIRKALGAKERDIWGQFLVDSSVLCLTGGIIGVIIGWGGAYLVNYLGWTTTVVSANVVLLAVGVAVGIGIFFGFYPAYQGSRLDPIQALRAE
jgi:putative ABC transport system permease protein